MKRVFLVDFDGIEMSSGEVMKTVEEEWYKYHGVFELDNIMHQEMKDRFKKECFCRRVRKILRSKLNGGNTAKAFNTWTVSIVTYGV